MATNEVQFQAGLSMSEFFERFGTDAQCEQALATARWPAGFACPICGSAQHCSFRRAGLLYWQCSECRHQTSVLSGTLFESTKLPLRRWFQALYQITHAKNGISALELKRHLGVSYRTAWLVKHKIMEAMRQREQWRQLDGLVQVDDAYLGGERSGGRVRDAQTNKVPFVVAVSTTPDGHAKHLCLSRQPLKSEELAGFAAWAISPHATVVSDGMSCFRHVMWIGATHQAIVTGGGRQAAQRQEFQAMNTVLGNLKTSLAGTYHAFAFAKYAHRYFGEIQYRFNRRFNLKSMLDRLLRAAATTSACPERFLRAAEVRT
jgi:transposase-like protein